ncbi:MAG: carotenoid biosynthesis protein [Bacteroidia bacterium]|nr:carotenoid biosynthesis protein [Bacteroidia bacterium]
MYQLTKHKFQVSLGILILFFQIGFIGISISPAFAVLTPLNLILSFGLLVWNQASSFRLALPALFFIFFGAFILEYMGVSTGLLFGQYSYGNALGPKLLQTPILIGLNWILVVYSSIQVVQWIGLRFKIKFPELLAAFLSAVLMVITDYPMEQICHLLDFWTWQSAVAPVQNYTAWFFFGFMFCFVAIKYGLHTYNALGPWYWVVQLVFFTGLNFTLN